LAVAECQHEQFYKMLRAHVDSDVSVVEMQRRKCVWL